MSNRALRRLQQQKDGIPGLPAAGEDSSADEEDENLPVNFKRKGKGKKKQIVNPFELLTENGDGDLEEEEAEEEESCEAVGNADAQDSATAAAASAAAKKKKKNKKKKKKASGNDVSPTSPAVEQVEDEIEASIQEVNRMLGGAALGSGAASSGAEGPAEFTVNMKAVLNIEYKYLSADNEMRRRFGSHVVQGEQGRARHRNRVPQRQGRLVQPKDNWPILGRTGLTMSVMEGSTADGEKCYTFEHSKDYQQVQFLFLDAVQSYNPQNIANLVHNHPYHIDSLIQLSEVFTMNEDAQTAVDLIERALYVFEGAFHPRFNMATGNCRLDFRRQENRAFFLALFKHLMAVGQRGCHRTALELCKLLLSLDPDGDPMCVLLMIDYYALRSDQHAFLLRLFEEWEAFRNLSQLPNFAFSVPLAMFHLAADNQGMAQKADDMLEEALLMFPGLLMTLLDKIGITPDKEVADHPFFGLAAQSSQKPALQQLVALYVGRSFTLWKEPEVMLWLERVVKDTLKLVDLKDVRIANFAEKRKVRYQGTPRNIYRHFMIAGIKDATATLPLELTNTAVLSYDPLPPLDAIVSYSKPPRQQPQGSPDESYMSLFLRSLLPNYNAQQEDGQGGNLVGAEGGGGGGGGEEEGGEGAVGPNGELRRGVGVLMDAMRDLLNNIRMAPPPVENPQGGEGGGGEGEEGQGEEEEMGEWD